MLPILLTSFVIPSGTNFKAAASQRSTGPPSSLTQRDAYIQKLCGVYQNNWNKEGIHLLEGYATIVSPTEDRVSQPGGERYSQDRSHLRRRRWPLYHSH